MSKNKYLIYILLILMLITVVNGDHIPSVSAAPANTAKNITSAAKFTLSDKQSTKSLTDDKESTFLKLKGGVNLTINSGKDFSGIYIKWNKIPGKWTLKINDGDIICGEDDFLHEFVKLDSPVKNVTMIMPKDGAQICDIYLFSGGILPDWVQVWQRPYKHADLAVIPTHSDDEQLYFAGVLPYYAGERGLKVQVIYLINHWRRDDRPHELLNGLWTVGVHAYPVIGDFPDTSKAYGDRGDTGEQVLKKALKVYGEEEVTKFQVEMIRRFHPKVIIGHDINGEYGHGAHRANAYTLQKALEISADFKKFPESAVSYGVWDVPKTYLHLWKENKITMDWDTPLEKFGGKTAFEMSKLGFACHVSQQTPKYTKWLYVDKAKDIKKYSPCEYGLYRTTVGKDVLKNDFFEHVIPYDNQDEPDGYPEVKHVPVSRVSTAASPSSLMATPSPVSTSTPALSPTPTLTPSPVKTNDTSVSSKITGTPESSNDSHTTPDPETHDTSNPVIPVLLGLGGIIIVGGSITAVIFLSKRKI